MSTRKQSLLVEAVALGSAGEAGPTFAVSFGRLPKGPPSVASTAARRGEIRHG
jgi:hypothetical protein